MVFSELQPLQQSVQQPQYNSTPRKATVKKRIKN
jgi:hypothetical protein